MPNPYEILEISRNATDEEVKRAYHKLAKKHHPDNFKAGNFEDNRGLEWATEQMQAINKAYAEIQKERANGDSSRIYYAQRYAGKKVGEIIRFGKYDWRVLAVAGSQILIITEDIIAQLPYNDIYKDVTWETCTLRKYLNGEFLRKFTMEEQKVIVKSDARGKIFILSLEEANKYFTDDSSRTARYGSAGSWWWLRSHEPIICGASYVYTDGAVYAGGFDALAAGGGVRPALRLRV